MADADTVDLKNVAAFSVMTRRVVERASHLPGLACFYGPSGYGKSQSARYAVRRYGAIYLECGMFTTARSFLTQLLRTLGAPPRKGSVPELIAQAVGLLALHPQRPLIIDEAHHIAQRRFLDLIREIHDVTKIPVILVGEEALPREIEAFERIHNRILCFEAAQPCDGGDFAALLRATCPQLRLSEALTRAILKDTRGNARRIVVRLQDVKETAAAMGLGAEDAIDLDTFGAERLQGFRAPVPRKFV